MLLQVLLCHGQLRGWSRRWWRLLCQGPAPLLTPVLVRLLLLLWLPLLLLLVWWRGSCCVAHCCCNELQGSCLPAQQLLCDGGPQVRGAPRPVSHLNPD